MAPESELVRDLYARFGVTYYHADVLHRGLCMLYATASMPSQGGQKRRFDELLAFAYSCTLGRIVNLAMPFLTDEIKGRLRDAVERRNFLAHHFWFDRIHLAFSVDGVGKLFVELDQNSDIFRALDADITLIVREHHALLGITDDSLESEMAEVVAGKALDAIRRQRRLKKREMVVRAYLAPVGADDSTLVFETDDGQLWQLCEVGLGWSPYMEPELDWRSADVLASLLPAEIDPRPQGAKPWHLDIDFGGIGTLLVRPDPSGKYRWSVRKR